MHTRGGTYRANASTLPANHCAIHCRRPDLAALLLALLHAHFTALHFLQLAAQRHSRATLPARQALGKRVCDRIPLRHHVRRRALFASYDLRASRPPTTSAACSSSPTTPPIAFGNCLRHLRVVHLPRHDYRARFRVRVPRLAPRAPCLLRPARQQTIYNVSGLLLPLSTTSFTMFGVCPVGSRALPRPHLGEARAGGCTRRAYESNPHIRPQASHLPIYACRTLTGVKLDFLLLRV
jgi:hypothetical protein